METIVVGVDGSPHADRAVQFAAHEARLREARVRLVSTWHVPAIAYGGPGVVPMVNLEDDFRLAAETVLSETAERLAADLEGLEVQLRAIQGRAATVLIEEAKSADLLVVGSRGHGGVAGLLLGSVSGECAQHAPGAVVIVHPPRGE